MVHVVSTRSLKVNAFFDLHSCSLEEIDESNLVAIRISRLAFHSSEKSGSDKLKDISLADVYKI